MTCRLIALCFDANNPIKLARFWSGLLGWELTGDYPEGGSSLRPNDDTGFRIRFDHTAEQKVGRNPLHLDLTSASLEEQQHTVDRAVDLGARHIDIGQLPPEGHVVLADPEGNEFCVIEPGNNFLADCGFLGAVSCDGSQAVGYFWSEALGWPLVWDQDPETAIRSPLGGSKITWGGTPPTSDPGTNRLHFDIAPAADADPPSEVDRLVSLGATRTSTLQDPVGFEEMTDPDGNRFCVVSA
jgi:predicted enzyme related to lactoylglutathione lyase